MNDQIEKLKEKVEKDPASKLFVPLAEEYRKAGMYDEAIGVLEAGLSRQPGYMSGRVALGKIFLEKGMKAEAQAEFERVVAAIPDNLYAQRKLADMYREQGDVDRARRAFQTVLDLHPRDEEARRILDELDSGVRPEAVPVEDSGVATARPAPEAEGAPIEAEPMAVQISADEIPELPDLPSFDVSDETDVSWGSDEAVTGLRAEGGLEEGGESFDIDSIPEAGETETSIEDAEDAAASQAPGGERHSFVESAEEAAEETAAYEIPDDEEYDLQNLGVEISARLTPVQDASEPDELEEFRKSMGESRSPSAEESGQEDPWAPLAREYGEEETREEGGFPDEGEIAEEASGVQAVRTVADDLAEGDRLIAAGRYEAAADLLKESLAHNPDDKGLAQRVDELTMLVSLVRRKSSQQSAQRDATVISGLEALREGFRGRKNDGI